MSDFFFISYSSVDGKNFAMKLADELTGGPPVIPVWLDGRALRPGEDWDEQVLEAIKTCKGMVFVLSADSVRPDSVCKNEWVRALKYKKPVIPLLLDKDADLPFRLGSREYIKFTDSFDSGLARLRKHLVWMDSQDGQLQALKYRLSDAQRELPRAEPEQQLRIKEDIVELERQIAQQQKIIDNPQAAEQRVQQSIDAGLDSERKPTKTVGGIRQSKFINPPPLIAPTWFQDRHFETRQIGDFLKDESLRLMTVVGRGGVGKSAMVCRLLRSLEGGQLPDDGGPLTVDGIVYLSAARSLHRTNLPDFYSGLTKLLSDDIVQQLDSVGKNPQATTRAIMEVLLQAFPHGRTIVLLDNFEDMIAVETRQIKDAELDDMLRAVLELPPHGIKIIITTRVAPRELAFVQPSLQRRLDLDTGLEHPYAENILRAMDADGKVGLRDASDELLAKARERTLGYPRALEHLFGILSADRDTLLEEILDNTKGLLPEKVVAVLVGEAFSRLDPTAQRVMQALATYRYPIPPAAADYLLQPFVPGIDSGRVLSRLVNMQFVHRDMGRYYLHQVDRDYAESRITIGEPSDRGAEIPPMSRFALRHRAAEWFKLSRKPSAAWKSLADLAAQLSEFDLRCENDDYDTAAALLLEFDFDYLLLWGHYRLMADLHERLQGKITDPVLAENSAGNLGSAYYRMGQVQRAISFYEKALQLSRERKDRWNEGTWLGNLGLSIGDLGDKERATRYLEESLAIRAEVGNRTGEASNLSNLAIIYSGIGQNTRAIDYCERALRISEETKDQEGEALHRANLCEFCRLHGRADESLRYHTEALAIARNIGYRYIEAATCGQLAELHLFHNRWDEAPRKLEVAMEIADNIGASQISKGARETLALIHLYQNDLVKAREMIATAQKYDIPLANHGTSAMLGVVALRQGDPNTAREAFTAAIDQASQLIALTPDWYEALDAKALSLCGLVLCGDPAQVVAAKNAYKAARTVTTDVGVIRTVLHRFDALAHADTNFVLAEVRPIAAGEKSG